MLRGTRGLFIKNIHLKFHRQYNKDNSNFCKTDFNKKISRSTDVSTNKFKSIFPHTAKFQLIEKCNESNKFNILQNSQMTFKCLAIPKILNAKIASEIQSTSPSTHKE